MSINTGAGTRFAIGPILTADLPKATADAMTLLKGITYVQVGEAETVGDYGDEAADANFTGLTDGRVRHLKGAFDAGNTDLTVGFDSGDVGQKAMVLAQKNRSRYDYPIQITYVDGQVDYFVGKVMSSRKTNISNGDVLRRNFTIGINSEIFEVLPA